MGPGRWDRDDAAGEVRAVDELAAAMGPGRWDRDDASPSPFDPSRISVPQWGPVAGPGMTASPKPSPRRPTIAAMGPGRWDRDDARVRSGRARACPPPQWGPVAGTGMTGSGRRGPRAGCRRNGARSLGPG